MVFNLHLHLHSQAYSTLTLTLIHLPKTFCVKVSPRAKFRPDQPSHLADYEEHRHRQSLPRWHYW